MAPTIYLSELSAVRKPIIPCSRRRQRVHNGAVAKQQRVQIRRLETNASSPDEASLTPPESPRWEPECPTDSYAPTIVSSSSPNVSARVPVDIKEHWKVFLARRKGLLDIVIRTMALVRRNNILQERVNALRAETRDFLHSVLNNPENKCIQQKLDAVDCDAETDVSSSTEKQVQRAPLLSTSDLRNFSSNDVTSTCDSSENDSEQSSDDDS